MPRQAPAPVVPLAVSDFKNGSYSIGGVPKSVSDLWDATSGFPFNAATDIVAGVGLTLTTTGNDQHGPTTTDLLKAAIGSQFVAVLEYELSTTDNSISAPAVAIDYTNFAVWGVGFDWFDNLTPEVNLAVLENFNGNRIRQPSGHSGPAKVAVLCSDTQLAFSRNGSVPSSLSLATPFDPTFKFAPTVINEFPTGVVGSCTATITKITFYPYTTGLAAVSK